MATVNEQIVTGRKFRKLIDEATKLWQRISFWTSASDVEFNDGSTAETKMGAINGITDSLASTSSNIAASAKSVCQLNNKLAGQPTFTYDNTGKIIGYKTPGGADTVFPFSCARGLSFSASMSKYGGAQAHILLPTFDCESIKYRINDKGTFVIGVTTESPADFTSFGYNSVQNIRNQKLYGYRQVLSQHLDTGATGTIDTKNCKSIYMTQEEQGTMGAITLTYC